MLTNLPQIVPNMTLMSKSQSNVDFPFYKIRKSQHDTFAHQFAFKGYIPEPKFAKTIKQIVGLIKSLWVRRIALVTHINPDGDAIGSMIALKRMIELNTKKKVDIIVLKDLPSTLKQITEKDEVRSVSEFAIWANKKPHTAEDIKSFFGTYDLAIAVDAMDPGAMDSAIVSGILNNAKKVIKIDHHPNLNSPLNYSNFGLVNLVDSSKESAAQLIMQFVKPMGIKLKHVTSRISDPILFGLLADTHQLTYTRGNSIFNDVAELSHTSNFKKINEASGAFDLNDIISYDSLKRQIRTTRDYEIRYLVLGEYEARDINKSVISQALVDSSRFMDTKYYFSIVKMRLNNRIVNLVKIESKDKSVKSISNKFGGQGNDSYCVIEFPDEDLEVSTKKILNELEALKNS